MTAGSNPATPALMKQSNVPNAYMGDEVNICLFEGYNVLASEMRMASKNASFLMNGIHHVPTYEISRSEYLTSLPKELRNEMLSCPQFRVFYKLKQKVKRVHK